MSNPHPSHDVEVSFVLPRHNEGFDIIDRTIRRLRTLQARNVIEIIIVNDSAYNSYYDPNMRRVRTEHPDVIVVSNGRNHGKGYSVRRGVDLARGRLVLYSDIDLPIEEQDFHRALACIDAGGHDIVAGDRSTCRAVRANRLRAWTSRGFVRLFNLLFDSRISDTQCPLKLMRSDVAKEIFSRQIIKGYAFDAEVIHLARLLSKSLQPLPVRWQDTRANWGLLRTARNYAVMVSDLVRVRLYWIFHRSSLRRPLHNHDG